MLILHNPLDKASREFVEANPTVSVLDWTNDQDRETWLAAGGTLAVSAFPSVMYERAAMVVVETDAKGQATRVEVPAGPEVVRLPDAMADAEACKAGHDALAAVTELEALAVTDPVAMADRFATATELTKIATALGAPLADQAEERLASLP